MYTSILGIKYLIQFVGRIHSSDDCTSLSIMNITELSIKRPSLVIVLFSILTLGGLFSYNLLPYELLPDMAQPVLTATTVYPGAAPGEVQNEVTEKIEDALSGLDNIDDIQSKSLENASIVIVNFKGGTDLDKAIQDAQQKIENVRKDLPDDAEPPVLSKISPSDQPIMQISANSALPNQVFYQKVEDDILPQIQQIKGVAEISLLGGEQREIRINVDHDKLTYYGLSLLQVTQAIGQANVEIPAGKMKAPTEQMTVKLAGKFSTVDDIRNLTVFTPPGGTAVRLQDLAEVSDGLRDAESIARYNGQAGIGISIKKSSDANAVEVSRQVRAKLTQLEESYSADRVHFVVADDSSIVTLKSVDAVVHDLFIAILLVAVVMLLFLHSLRNALMVLVSIPVSLISAFLMMYFLDYTLNLMTLLGMSLVIGILVDDSIVVLENIQRHLEMGKSRLQATLDGMKEIGFAAVAITLVIVCVFLPVTFLSTMVADVLRQFSYTVAFATLVSLLASFTLTPWLSSRFGKLEHLNPKNPFQWFLLQFEKLLTGLNAWYGRAVEWTLSHKLAFGGLVAALFVGIGWVMGLGIMGEEMFAEGDQGKFRLRMEASKSTPLRQNNLVSQEIEQYLLQKPEVESVFANVGGPRAGVGSTGLGAENETELTVQLRTGESGANAVPTVQYMIGLQNELSARYPGVEFSASNVGIVGMATAPIEIILTGPDQTELLAAGQQLKRRIQNVPGANDVQVSVEDNGNPELRVELDREKMAQLGLNTLTVGATLRNAFAGNDDARFRDNGTEYDIRVQLDAFDRNNPDDVRRLSFVNNEGRIVQLGQFADIVPSAGPSQLERKDRQNSVTVSAFTIGRAPGTVAQDIDKMVAANPLPASVKMIWSGDIKRQQESFGAMGLAMLAALILIYLILVTLYDNFVYPLVVLFSIPVSLIGALLALNLSMTNMSIFTMLGMLMLLGLVAKNAILIVDFTNQLKARGKPFREAIVEASRERLRPILMTTIAMVVGMIPIAVAKGADAEWKNGLAWVLIGGLLSSMALTVFVVPVMYYLVDRVKEIAARVLGKSRETAEGAVLQKAG